MICITNVTKEINNNVILKNINLKFREKGLAFILGPSGSGKTTLLNLIGKIDIPTKGNILYYNNDIKNISDYKYHNQIVSFIFQDYNLLTNLNFYDNLFLLPNLNKKISNYQKIIKNLKLDGVNKKENINKLSGGEKQRIAICRCLMQNTSVILADEPTGALDSENSLAVMDLLKKASKNKLVIVVTHNEFLAQKYGDRIIRIEDGSIKSDTNPFYGIIPQSIKLSNFKVPFKDILKISLKNIKVKKKRCILTSLAFAIGLLSLSLILSIKNGFSKEINKYEQEYLYNYPLIISKEGISLNNDVLKEEKIITGDFSVTKDYSLITNSITKDLLKQVENLNPHLYEEITYYKDIDYNFKKVSYVINDYKKFTLISGRYPRNNNEVVLLLNYNNSLSESVYNYLNIFKCNYKDYLNTSFIVNNQKLKIVGFVKSDNSYYSSLNGILYQSSLFDRPITDIYIYPQNYHSKITIKENLKNVNIIDNAESTLSLLKNLIKTISIILILFSIISIIVSIFMIYIITFINTLERTKEIGILKSIGYKNRHIKKIFICESNIICLFSFFISITLCLILNKLLSTWIYQKIEIKNLASLNINIILFILIFSIIISYISSFIPASKASKKRIIDSLKSNE